MKDHKIHPGTHSSGKDRIPFFPSESGPDSLQSRLTLVIPLLVSLIFLFDITTPLGLSVWLLYFIPLFLCFWVDRELAIPTICTVTLLFLGAGFLFSPPGLHTSYALINRILFAGIFICASVVLWIIRHHQTVVEQESRSGREHRFKSPVAEGRPHRFPGILNARLIPALNSARSTLKVLREGKRPVDTDDLARSEETIAHAEQEILFTGKLETIGKSPPQWQNLSEIIWRRIPDVRKRGIDVVTGQGSLWLYADPLLPDVLDELIDNTVRYGTVSTTIRIVWMTENGGLILTFEDDGIGIPFSQKERIFYNSVGRGLVLAREVLGVTGITIRETGIPEQGARFTIAVPEHTYRIG